MFGKNLLSFHLLSCYFSFVIVDLDIQLVKEFVLDISSLISFY